ncbi:MAG TPA: HTH-type transcriptional repressor FabR [Solimonas sp.]|nr:HTH-type transcriptional repressor FabR [Solimonas sp.]
MSIQLYINACSYDADITTRLPYKPLIKSRKSPASATRAPAGRKAAISRDDIIAAALKLVGPHRSVSTLSLREVAREADIAPNSFYRHFHDIDELAIALIELSGRSLRQIIGSARQRASTERSVVRSSVEAFMEQLGAEGSLLHILLREGMVGSEAFKQTVERQLQFFEDELRIDLIRLAEANGTGLHEPILTAKAITRLVFAIGTTAMDLPREQHPAITDQLELMVRMIVVGTQTMARYAGGASDRA